MGTPGAENHHPLVSVRRGQIHAVAVQRLDRLSRRVSQCAGILDEFRRAGVDVLIAEIPESANGASGRLLTNLLSSFAEFERGGPPEIT